MTLPPASQTSRQPESPRRLPNGGRRRSRRWRGLRHWLSPTRAWRKLRRGGVGRREMAAGLAVGVFIANLPAYGLQTALSLLAARWLRLNPLAVFAGSQISTPPIGPLLNAAAIWVGHALLHGQARFWVDVRNQPIWKSAGPILLDWIVGSLIVGAAMALASYFIANLVFRLMEQKRVPPSAG